MFGKRSVFSGARQGLPGSQVGVLCKRAGGLGPLATRICVFTASSRLVSMLVHGSVLCLKKGLSLCLSCHNDKDGLLGNGFPPVLLGGERFATGDAWMLLIRPPMG